MWYWLTTVGIFENQNGAQHSLRRKNLGPVMSLMGHQRHFERALATSALAPIPDVLLSRSKRRSGHNQISRQVPADCETRYSLQWKV